MIKKKHLKNNQKKRLKVLKVLLNNKLKNFTLNIFKLKINNI